MKQTINVPMSTGEHVEVEAEVFGSWAVHESPDLVPCSANVITHVPTGMRMGHWLLAGINKGDASKIARRLRDAYPTLPDDVLPKARGEAELSEVSAAFMRRLGEFLADVALEVSSHARALARRRIGDLNEDNTRLRKERDALLAAKRNAPETP